MLSTLFRITIVYATLHAIESTWGTMGRYPSFQHHKSNSKDSHHFGNVGNWFNKGSRSSHSKHDWNNGNTWNKGISWKGYGQKSSGSNDKSSSSNRVGHSFNKGSGSSHSKHDWNNGNTWNKGNMWSNLKGNGEKGSGSKDKSSKGHTSSSTKSGNGWQNLHHGSQSRKGIFQNWADKFKGTGNSWLQSKLDQYKNKYTDMKKSQQVSTSTKPDEKSKDETIEDETPNKTRKEKSHMTEKSSSGSNKSEKSKHDVKTNSNSSDKSEKSSIKGVHSSHKENSKKSGSSSSDSRALKTSSSKDKSKQSSSKESSKYSGKSKSVEKEKSKITKSKSTSRSKGIQWPPRSKSKPLPSSQKEKSKPFPWPPKEKSKPFPWPPKEKSKPLPWPPKEKSKPFPWPPKEKSKPFPWPPKDKSKDSEEQSKESSIQPKENKTDTTSNRSNETSNGNLPFPPKSRPFPPKESSRSKSTTAKIKSSKEKSTRPEKNEELPRFGPTLKPPYKRAKVCKKATPSCCVGGEVTIDLNNVKGKKSKEGGVEGVRVLGIEKGQGRNKKQACSSSTLIVVDFDKIDNSRCFGCLEAPYCGKRMLKIQLKLSNGKRNGWLFNIGDSESNNGYRGDSNDQMNDAETQALFPNITVYPSDKCPTINSLMHIVNAVANNVDTVTLYISNEHIKITNSDGLNFKLCHKCLYALNGQPDSGPNGVPNERICIGLNRVVKDLSRTGYGVCSAILSWECPWCM